MYRMGMGWVFEIQTLWFYVVFIRMGSVGLVGVELMVFDV